MLCERFGTGQRGCCDEYTVPLPTLTRQRRYKASHVSLREEGPQCYSADKGEHLRAEACFSIFCDMYRLKNYRGWIRWKDFSSKVIRVVLRSKCMNTKSRSGIHELQLWRQTCTFVFCLWRVASYSSVQLSILQTRSLGEMYSYILMIGSQSDWL